MKVGIQIRFQWKRHPLTPWRELEFQTLVPENILDQVFRLQNRVELEDELIFDLFPSLSAGDLVSLRFDDTGPVRHFYCNSYGWNELDTEQVSRYFGLWASCDDLWVLTPYDFGKTLAT